MLKMEELFHTNNFIRRLERAYSHYEYAGNPIEHPLATIDRGFR
ncbi:hypothetical protein [Bacillus sp. 2205SS5-2]